MRYTVMLVASSLLISTPALGQSARDEALNFPTKPVRIIVPFPPGGGSEAFARSIAAKLTERWGQQVISGSVSIDGRA